GACGRGGVRGVAGVPRGGAAARRRRGDFAAARRPPGGGAPPIAQPTHFPARLFDRGEIFTPIEQSPSARRLPCSLGGNYCPQVNNRRVKGIGCSIEDGRRGEGAAPRCDIPTGKAKKPRTSGSTASPRRPDRFRPLTTGAIRYPPAPSATHRRRPLPTGAVRSRPTHHPTSISPSPDTSHPAPTAPPPARP